MTIRGKAIVEATFAAINTLFCQHVTGYTGSNTQLRGDQVSAEAAWTVPDLQDLLDEHFSDDEARRQLETAIQWGRYAELFDYDAASGKLTLTET